MKTLFRNCGKYLWPGLPAFIIGVGIILHTGGCKKESPGAGQVYMQNTAFNPGSITISQNSSVTWTNKDNMTHNVTSNDGSFASGDMPVGATYTHTFTNKGTYPYRCTIHQ